MFTMTGLSQPFVFGMSIKANLHFYNNGSFCLFSATSKQTLFIWPVFTSECNMLGVRDDIPINPAPSLRLPHSCPLPALVPGECAGTAIRGIWGDHPFPLPPEECWGGVLASGLPEDSRAPLGLIESCHCSHVSPLGGTGSWGSVLRTLQGDLGFLSIDRCSGSLS